MAIPSIQQEKRDCRNRFRRILTELEEPRRAVWSEQVTGHLASWLSRQSPTGPVALYAAFGFEVELAGLRDLLGPCALLYPRITPAGLEFRQVRDAAELHPGRFGIREPDPARHPVIGLRRIDVCLCPGLAFSADGVRLGRGKGYYDFALRGMRPDIPRVGVGFALQQCATLPHESHDVRMTHLANENGVREIIG